MGRSSVIDVSLNHLEIPRMVDFAKVNSSMHTLSPIPCAQEKEEKEEKEEKKMDIMINYQKETNEITNNKDGKGKESNITECNMENKSNIDKESKMEKVSKIEIDAKSNVDSL